MWQFWSEFWLWVYVCVYRNRAASMFTKADVIMSVFDGKQSAETETFLPLRCAIHFILSLNVFLLWRFIYFPWIAQKIGTHKIYECELNEWIFFCVWIHMKISMGNALFLLYFSGEHLTPHPKLNGEKERFVCIKKDTMKTIVIPKKDELIGNGKIYCKIAVATAHCLAKKRVFFFSFLSVCKYEHFNRKHWWCVSFANVSSSLTYRERISNLVYKNQQKTIRATKAWAKNPSIPSSSS